MNVTAILVAALVVGGVGILIGFVVMPDVPDLLQRSQKVKHQSTSVRSAELQLQLRSVQSWV